jgi:phage-related protein
MSRRFQRQWRDYRSASGRLPVKEFISELSDEEAADVAVAMAEVRVEGLPTARHLRGDIYEARAESAHRSFRILFATEGRFGQVLLAVVAFSKKTQRTPPRQVALAEARLTDWRSRGRKQ